MHLEDIRTPADVRALTVPQVEALAAEIRVRMTESVLQTGGHLASNLGAVELTLALHRALDTPRDKIVFDVGHQSYTHKLITGRADRLETLRGEGGLSGFPKRAESEYDTFETGHASTALSAALGMARARDAMGEDYTVAAVVGDGALTGGMCYEALNDAGSRPTQLIMLLNDNEMSIAHNVGALSTYLTRLRGSERWIDTKHAVKRGLHRVPIIGAPIAGAFERVKRTLRLMLVPGEFFEALGFGYLGPIDGHDIPTLERALRDARAMGHPVVIHAVTQKGRGYAPAEARPEIYHGVAPFFVEDGGARAGDERPAGEVAGETLLALAREDARILSITAAMQQGTGLSAFAEALPDRFFDVGIAEEHAMTLAAGMAGAGMRPVFCVYATFLQRAVDQLLHDVCLQRLPVTLLVGHAGFVSGDGATHQGIYDVAMLRAMPNLTIWAPCDARELRTMLRAALSLDGPCAIRYPKLLPEAQGEPAEAGRWRVIEPGGGVLLVGYGHSVAHAREAAALLRAEDIDCAVWSASCLSTLDEAAQSAMRAAPLTAVVEEAQAAGGLGEAVVAALGDSARVLPLAVPGIAPQAHSPQGLAAECGLDAATITTLIKEALRG